MPSSKTPPTPTPISEAILGYTRALVLLRKNPPPLRLNWNLVYEGHKRSITLLKTEIERLEKEERDGDDSGTG